MIDYDLLKSWREEHNDLSDSDFLELTRAVVSESQLVNTQNVAVYLANNEHLSTALFMLKMSSEPTLQKMHYEIEMAFRMPQINLRNPRFQAIRSFKNMPGAGVTDADIEGFFSLVPVTAVTAAQEKFGEEVTQSDLNILHNQYKIMAAEQKAAELLEAARQMRGGELIDLAAYGIE